MDLTVVEIDTYMFFVFEDIIDMFIVELFLESLKLFIIGWDLVKLQVETVQLQA